MNRLEQSRSGLLWIELKRGRQLCSLRFQTYIGRRSDPNRSSKSSCQVGENVAVLFKGVSKKVTGGGDAHEVGTADHIQTLWIPHHPHRHCIN